jgi:hypothetical protein
MHALARSDTNSARLLALNKVFQSLQSPRLAMNVQMLA